MSPTVSLITQDSQWDDWVRANKGHPMQLSAWGRLKSGGAWQPRQVQVRDAQGNILGGALLLTQALPFPFGALTYCPRGPVVPETSNIPKVLNALSTWVRNEIGGVGLMLEPTWEADEVTIPAGWRSNDQHVLHPVTLILDLVNNSIDELLTKTNKTRRRQARRALPEGFFVTRTFSPSDIDQSIALLRSISEQNNFGIHVDEYYRQLFEEFGEDNRLYVVKNGDTVHAFDWMIATPDIATSLFAAQDEVSRKGNMNDPLTLWYLRDLADSGIARYDFNGLLDDGIGFYKRSWAQHENVLVGTWSFDFGVRAQLWWKVYPLAKKLVRMIRRK